MTALIHVVYVSEATADISDGALRDLLGRARKHNASADLTGLLLHVERSFLQVLEGTHEAVGLLYAKIGLDKRHDRVVKLIEEPIEQRDFQDWTMGIARVTAKELAGIAGLSDFFVNRSSLDGLGEGTARRLLDAFREGRWRTRVA